MWVMHVKALIQLHQVHPWACMHSILLKSHALFGCTCGCTYGCTCTPAGGQVHRTDVHYRFYTYTGLADWSAQNLAPHRPTMVPPRHTTHILLGVPPARHGFPAPGRCRLIAY